MPFILDGPLEFEASQGSSVRWMVVVVHTCDPSALEAVAEALP